MVEGLTVMVLKRYSDTVRYGGVISQSEPAGTELIGDTAQVTVIYSLGRPYLEDLRGQSQSILAQYFYDYSSQGAFIDYQVIYLDSSAPKGEIIYMSQYSQPLGLYDSIVIGVSLENLPVQVPPERSQELKNTVIPVR